MRITHTHTLSLSHRQSIICVFYGGIRHNHTVDRCAQGMLQKYAKSKVAFLIQQQRSTTKVSSSYMKDRAERQTITSERYILRVACSQPPNLREGRLSHGYEYNLHTLRSILFHKGWFRPTRSECTHWRICEISRLNITWILIPIWLWGKRLSQLITTIISHKARNGMRPRSRVILRETFIQSILEMIRSVGNCPS